jgi:hypothetical protein
MGDDIPWGIRPSVGWAIFLGYSFPGGGIPRNIAPFWEGGESPGGGQKSCDNGMGKNLSCPPKYEFAPQIPQLNVRPGASQIFCC